MLLFGLIIVILIVVIYGLMHKTHKTQHRSQRFYEIADTYPMLEGIPRNDVMKELSGVTVSTDWVDWPEKDLWDAGDTGARWTVFPLIAFGRRVDRNCNKMPKLMKFISEIDRTYGVNIAILSRLGPGMKLVPHQGWGAHSNKVLRCHYGLVVPTAITTNRNIRDCRVEVADEISDKCKCTNNTVSPDRAVSTNSKDPNCYECYDGYVYEARRHREGEWIIFDDSKMHMAENTTTGDRIVLIMDIVRPDWVPLGTSTVEDTTELKNIIAEYSRADE